MSADETRFDGWLADLEARHLADLTFSEVARALRALSSAYVERRRTLSEGAALSGAGKRAAFALFYGPLHFLLVQYIARNLGNRVIGTRVVDLGCGTGAAGAALASVSERPPAVDGFDRHPWAIDEARRTYRHFGLRAQTRIQDIGRAPLHEGSTVLLAFAVNELSAAAREPLLASLLAHGQRGSVLIVEPLAGFVAPWWRGWQRAFESAGGAADEWRLQTKLPPIVEKLDRAAGLHHREITGRSLWLKGA